MHITFQLFYSEFCKGTPVLAALVDNKLKSLDYKIINPHNIRLIGYDHPDGRRTYIRSLCFVLQNVVKEMFPDKNFTVNAFLMLADKSRTATVNGLNQLFKIKSAPNKRSEVITASEAMAIVNAIPVSDRVVRAFYVDDICDKIIAGEYEEQQDAEFMMGMGFKAFVEMMAVDYCKHIKTDCIIGSKCFKCPFHKKANDKSDKLDGYSECWIEKALFQMRQPLAAARGFPDWGHSGSDWPAGMP